jgi:MFS family permease
MLKVRLPSTAVIQVLRHRRFAWLLGAQLAEDASDSIYLLVLPWLVLEAGGSGVDIGLTGAAAVLPFLLISPIAGVVVDRVDRSLVLMGPNAIRALVLFTVLLVGWLVDLETWHLATAAFVLTTADVFAYSARGALLPTLVPREDLVAANSASAVAWTIMNIGGRAVAGFLVFLIGSLGTITVSIGLYVAAISLLARIGGPVESKTTIRTDSSFRFKAGLVDLLEAITFMVRHPLIRALTLAGVVLNSLQYPLLTTLLPVFLDRALDAGPRAYGLFLSATSAGVFIAMLIAPRVARSVGEGRLCALSLILWGLALGLIGIAGNLYQALILAGLLGFIGGLDVPIGSLLQAETPDEIRGRVMANTMAANLALVPLTFVMAGFLMDTVGPRPLYPAAGLLVVVCGLWLLASRVVRTARLTAPAGAQVKT